MAPTALLVTLIIASIAGRVTSQQSYEMQNPPQNEHQHQAYNQFQHAVGNVVQHIQDRNTNTHDRHLLLTNPNTLETSEKQQLLDAHNLYRSQTALGTMAAPSGNQPQAANMNKLFWDPALEKVARDYATGCYIEHNDNRQQEMISPTVAPLATFTYPSSAPTNGLSCGENIYYSSLSNPDFYGAYDIEQSTVGWMPDEADDWYVILIIYFCNCDCN